MQSCVVENFSSKSVLVRVEPPSQLFFVKLLLSRQENQIVKIAKQKARENSKLNQHQHEWTWPSGCPNGTGWFKTLQSEYLLFTQQAVWVLKNKVFGQESTVVKWNYQILSLHLVTVHQKVPILDFQSEFSMSKIIRIFLKKNFIEKYQFRRIFFVKSIFCWLQF